MTNSESNPLSAAAAFELLTSPDWMLSRRAESWHNGYYLEDLIHLQAAYESGKMADLPRRIVLSYLESRIRESYAPPLGEQSHRNDISTLVLLMPYDLDEVIHLASLVRKRIMKKGGS